MNFYETLISLKQKIVKSISNQENKKEIIVNILIQNKITITETKDTEIIVKQNNEFYRITIPDIQIIYMKGIGWKDLTF